MKVAKFSIPAVNVNAGYTLDVKKTRTDALGNVTTFYPTGVRIKNVTGATVGLVFLASADEVADYADNVDFYDYIPVDTATSFITDARLLYNINKIVIKTLTGVAASALEIFCTGYK
jgi:hypothetical protein